MARSKFRRTPRVENLESRQLLSSVGPATAEQQDMLYLVNLARTDPPAAAYLIGSNITPDIQATLQHYGVDLNATEQAIASAAKLPPVAWNNQLAQAAQAHSQDMAANQDQSHTGSDGSSPQQRMQRAGYPSPTTSNENAYAYATSVDQAMEAFLIDWGVPDNGHRNTILQPGVSAQNAYRDVGIGITPTSGASSVGPLVVTQDFASRANEPAQLVGVVFNDPNHTGLYDPSYGAANVQIDAVNLQTGQVSSTQTGSFGGYQLPLSAGSYRIIASVNDQVIQTATINVGDVNVELDFNASNPWQGGLREAALAEAQPGWSPPVIQRQPAPPQPTSPSGVGAINWNWMSLKATN
jgi:uncharacterized protein YkwD